MVALMRTDHPVGSVVQHWQTRRTTASPGPYAYAHCAAREIMVSVLDLEEL